MARLPRFTGSLQELCFFHERVAPGSVEKCTKPSWMKVTTLCATPKPRPWSGGLAGSYRGTTPAPPCSRAWEQTGCHTPSNPTTTGGSKRGRTPRATQRPKHKDRSQSKMLERPVQGQLEHTEDHGKNCKHDQRHNRSTIMSRGHENEPQIFHDHFFPSAATERLRVGAEMIRRGERWPRRAASSPVGTAWATATTPSTAGPKTQQR